MYIELHARSAFSFLEGASVPEELAEVCAAHQMPAMALLDRDGVYGAPRFHLAMKKLNLKAHIGAEITSLLPGAKARSNHVPVTGLNCPNECKSGPRWGPQSPGSSTEFVAPRLRCCALRARATRTSAA